MRIFGVIGWKNSGKTHLMVRLISELTSRGYDISSIKHAHHTLGFATEDANGVDQLPTGAQETIFASPTRWSWVKEAKAEVRLDNLTELVTRLQPVDLVLIEGYKLEGHTKLEAYRAGSTRDPIALNDDRIVALASDVEPQGVHVPVFDLNDTRSIADFILDHVGLARQANARG